MIGLSKKVIETKEIEETIVTNDIIMTPIESLSSVVKEPVNYLENISLKFSNVEIEYLPILEWLLENIKTHMVEPYVSAGQPNSNIESSINKVRNILTGKRFNGILEIEKMEIPSDIPTTTRVEVKLL